MLFNKIEYYFLLIHEESISKLEGSVVRVSSAALAPAAEINIPDCEYQYLLEQSILFGKNKLP